MSRIQTANSMQRQGGDYNISLYHSKRRQQRPEGIGRAGEDIVWKAVCGLEIHIAEALRHALCGRNTYGHGNKGKHEEQAHVDVG